MLIRCLLGLVAGAVGLIGAEANSLSPAEKEAGWRLLFNGKDLQGWQEDKWNPGGFGVADGAIKCHGQPAMLYYVGDGAEMTDFHFVADVMTKPNANSGIFFHTRYQDRGWPVGHEAQVNTSHKDPVKTGSVYIVKKYLEQAAKDNEWFRYEIIVRGKTVTTKVNGKTLVTYEEPESKGRRKLSSGTIGLQAHDPGSVVYYKNIKVRPLSGALTRAERVALRSGKWYDQMDFGPALQTHVGVGKEVVLRGVAARLGAAEDQVMVYDAATMSLRAAGAGWLKMEGTPWNGKHGGNPKLAGSAVVANVSGPGWAKNGSFEDPRDSEYGPLPTDWAKYKGRYVHGDETIVHYTVGGVDVYEHPTVETQGDATVYVRNVYLPQTTTAMTMRVVNQPGGKVTLLGGAPIGNQPDDQATDLVPLQPGVNVVVDRTMGSWGELAMGSPQSDDQGQGKTVTSASGDRWAKPHPRSGADGMRLPRLTDGQFAGNLNDLNNNIWYDVKEHSFVLDLGAAISVARVNTFSWHGGDRAPQWFSLAGSLDQQEWTQIAKVDSRALGDAGKHGSSVLAGEGALGRYRYLRWQMPAVKHGTFFSEIDVYALGKKLPAIRTPGGGGGAGPLYVGAAGGGVRVHQPEPGQVLVEVPAGKRDLAFKVVMSAKPVAKLAPPTGSIAKFLEGGPTQWPGTVKVKGTRGQDNGPYATDDIPVPTDNPWQSEIRFGGFDFFADGKRAAACTWNGDVWIVSGIDGDLQNLEWKRYAAGLFETLGLRIVDDVVYVTGKDQITRLHDLNGDGEADYYECFNNDVKITQNFHEFTFGLQTDADGNFYFAKASPVRAGGRGFGPTHENHGVVFKVSKDGSASEVVGNGLRAPGGLGVGPNGEVTTGENEGTFAPACKINWVTKGSFSGVIHPGNGRTMEQGYDPPLCWLPMTVDNSGGGQVWVDSDKWGPFAGELLHLSYGRSSMYKVMRQEVGGVMQGGVVKLPIKLGSSAMRGRFNPVDKQLYVIGFRGWQTNAAKACAFQRVRYTGKPVLLPTELKATKKGIYLTFTEKLDAELAEDVESYAIRWWQYVWGPQYGSAHFSISDPDLAAMKLALEKETKAGGTRGSKVAEAGFKGDVVAVKSAKLQADGKTVFLEIPGIREDVMQMKISLDVETTDGEVIVNDVYNTIHKLAE